MKPVQLNWAHLNETIWSLMDDIKCNLKEPEKIRETNAKLEVKIYHSFVNGNLMRLIMGKVVHWDLLIL